MRLQLWQLHQMRPWAAQGPVGQLTELWMVTRSPLLATRHQMHWKARKTPKWGMLDISMGLWRMSPQLEQVRKL